MTLMQRIFGIALVLMMLVALAGCGGQPVALAEIPVHPGAAPLQAGSNTLADSVADGFRKAIGQEKVKLDMQLYTLPADTSWEDVKSFYEAQIKTDWKAEARLAQDSEAFKTIGWTRGSFSSEQGLAIGYGPALLGNPPFLMVALFSE